MGRTGRKNICVYIYIYTHTTYIYIYIHNMYISYIYIYTHMYVDVCIHVNYLYTSTIRCSFPMDWSRRTLPATPWTLWPSCRSRRSPWCGVGEVVSIPTVPQRRRWRYVFVCLLVNAFFFLVISQCWSFWSLDWILWIFLIASLYFRMVK